MLVTLLILGIWSLGVYGKLFRTHMPVFLFLWFFIPVIALWLNTGAVRSAFSISSLKIVRNFLLGAVISLSFASFVHYDLIRDFIGQRIVDGYEVRYYEDTDEYGRTSMAADVSTDHWYSRLGLWLFEWGFLGICAAIPYATWLATNRAINAATLESP